MMELTIQLIPTGEIILSPGKNGENCCHNCKVSSHTVLRSEAKSGVRFFHSSLNPVGFLCSSVGRNRCWHSWGYGGSAPMAKSLKTLTNISGSVKRFRIRQKHISVQVQLNSKEGHLNISCRCHVLFQPNRINTFGRVFMLEITITALSAASIGQNPMQPHRLLHFKAAVINISTLTMARIACI